MKYTVSELISYEKEVPSLHSIGLLVSHAVSSPEIAETDKKILLKLRKELLKISLRRNNKVKITSTLAYVQAVQISTRVINNQLVDTKTSLLIN